MDFRALGLAGKLPGMTTEAVLTLLSGNGNLIKRPFALDPQRGIFITGFKKPEWEAALAGAEHLRSARPTAKIAVMISTKNPFPGMNPWLQQSWRDVHTRLITHISEALSPELPPDLASRTERRVALLEEGRPPAGFITDVAVTESWRHGLPPVWSPESNAAIAVADPLLLDAEPLTERWVEILDLDGRVITIIEVLSPSNKQGDDRTAYRAKTRGYLEAGVNLVEIDLIRGGQHSLRVAESELPRRSATTHYICVCRAILKNRREVYPCPLRERLPAIRIPLRPTDPDIPLDLQPLVDRCYELGRYWQLKWSEPLNPPLPDDDALWAQEQLKVAGLHG